MVAGKRRANLGVAVAPLPDAHGVNTAEVQAAWTDSQQRPVSQLICSATGETAAALLGPLTGGLVGEALRRHGCRLLPVAAPATLLGHAAVVTYCLQQRPALLPLSPVCRRVAAIGRDTMLAVTLACAQLCRGQCLLPLVAAARVKKSRFTQVV